LVFNIERNQRSVLAKCRRTWELHDALGSVRLHLDDAGAALAPQRYSPFGTPTVGSPAPFGFAGEMHLGGLQYLRARWYDPAAGVFVGRDPFAGFDTMPYSLHPYQYGYSDPVRWTDPSGKNPGAIVVAGLTVAELAFLLTIGAITLTSIEVCVVQQQCGEIEYAWEEHGAQISRGAGYLGQLIGVRGENEYVWVNQDPPEQEGFSQEQLEPYIPSSPLSEGVCVEPEYYPWVEIAGVEIEHMPTNEAQDLLLDWAFEANDGRGYVDNVALHLGKLRNNPQSRDWNHWLVEINASLHDLHKTYPNQSLTTILQRQGFSETEVDKFIETLQEVEYAANSMVEVPGSEAMGVSISKPTLENLQQNLANLGVETWDW
jgi:RHS repeat-associated protein